eukprot:8031539-Pyramimonas_sp.AAC.1
MLEPNVISYNAGISACEKCEQWQWALALLSDMPQVGSQKTPGRVRTSKNRPNPEGKRTCS